MKRFFIILSLISLCLSAYGGAKSENGWTGVGVSWANQWEKQAGIDYTAKISSFGIDMDSYQFKNENNYGSFSHGTIMFPQRGTIDSNGVGISIKLRDYYDSIFSIGGILVHCNIKNVTLF